MKIEKIDINLIKEYENNTKEHPEWQIEQIKNSIQEFGYNDPIAIDENNIIIEGHGRYSALKELGYKEIEAIRLTGLTEEQKSAYAIAHNKLTMNTEFDIEKLKYELNKLEVAEFDLNLLGFEEVELENIVDNNDIEISIPEYDYLEEDEETGKKINEKMLIFGKIKIPLTDEEYEMMNKEYDEYVKTNGVSYGFVSNIFIEK